jgi:hypothetical protein
MAIDPQTWDYLKEAMHYVEIAVVALIVHFGKKNSALSDEVKANSDKNTAKITEDTNKVDQKVDNVIGILNKHILDDAGIQGRLIERLDILLDDRHSKRSGE